MLESGARLALIGEAPGYRGCAVTGVPLTSLALLRADLGRWGLFAPLRLCAAPELGDPERELTATVVWQQLLDAWPASQPPPLTFNAFPFHPHPPGAPHANRSLISAELAEGAGYLHTLLALAPTVAPLAMGRRAEAALTRLGVVPRAVLRHPSHGGSTAFGETFRAFCIELIHPEEEHR